MTSRDPWIGRASTSIVPPPDYWEHIAAEMAGPQLDRLRRLSDERVTEFTSSGLPPPEDTATELLERVAGDGWVERQARLTCPNCQFALDDEQAAQPVCPRCGESYEGHGGVVVETIYVRHLAPSRAVDWIVAIHGMNTTGAWQEAFSWQLATTWGQSVPVAVYKYGIVIAGVVMAWRRRKLQRDLRTKLATLRDEAEARGFSGKPDAIAHSFGTWLLGHLLQNELTQSPEERLRFGRIILTGCVLRPDFDWRSIKDAGLVDDVMNHYGTRDPIVPLAHVAIRDSGPSGRRGFDGDQVLNLRAEGYGHSDLFSITKCFVDDKPFRPCGSGAAGTSHLEHSYKRYWRPFLTLPHQELNSLPDRADPSTAWHQLWWPLRGTIFPFVVLPLIAALVALLVAGLGQALLEVWSVSAVVAAVAAGLTLIFVGIGMALTWRQLSP